ncbi:hypothetical protein MUP59_09880 [Candidatus Bathyarchaeota archaeon]|nr:hypothetical protein [Candidatus Bathyarchaeota archaeon]
MAARYKMRNPNKRFTGVAFDKRDRELLEKAASMRGGDVSSFIRESCKIRLAELGFLPKEECQALGIRPPTEQNEREALQTVERKG